LLTVVANAVEKRARAKAPQHPVADTVAWRELDGLVAAKLEECTGMVFVRTDPPQKAAEHRASLFMLDVARDAHLGVALFAPTAMGVTLSTAILRDPHPTDACARELLAELCNNVCGALKTSTAEAGFGFTM